MKMESFRIRLEARDPARGCFVPLAIEAGIDLLGDWLVDVTMAASAPRAGVEASPKNRNWPARG